jgi:hypothetical protein
LNDRVLIKVRNFPGIWLFWCSSCLDDLPV